MAIEKALGKISTIEFGLGGYQDACIGLSISFDCKGCFTGTFIGGWDPAMVKCDKYTKWTEAQRGKQLELAVRKLSELLKQTGKKHVGQLRGTPVEITFEDNTLKDWRVLTEVL
jgi:hypothetical protein